MDEGRHLSDAAQSARKVYSRWPLSEVYLWVVAGQFSRSFGFHCFISSYSHGAGAAFDDGRDLSSGYEHTVVDVGGRDGSGLRSALILANVAIVPCGASSLDGAALTDLLEVVDLAKDINPSLKLKVLLTRIDTRTKDTAAMEAYLRENHLEVLNTKIYERVAYRRSIADGATVTEKPLKDEQANLEMRHFFAEVNQ